MNDQGPRADFLDVLGISPEWVRARSVSDFADPDISSSDVSGRPALAIFADSPSAEEAMVLGKIISALKMDLVPVQSPVDFNNDRAMVRVRLCFTDERAPSANRREGELTGWDVFLPPLNELVGEGVEVMAKKKMAWNLLKQVLNSDLSR